MNDSDFNDVSARLRELFPSLRLWLRTFDTDIATAIAKRWEMAIRRSDRDDCIAAIDWFAIQPDDPWPFDNSKERVGAIIASKAAAIAQARREVAWAAQKARNATGTRQPRANAAGFDSSAALREVSARLLDLNRHSDMCRRYRAAGRTYCHESCTAASEIAREVVASMDRSDPLESRRYGCPMCLDTGFAHCLKAREIVKAINGLPFSTTGFALYTVACSCGNGDAHAERQLPNGQPQYVRFEPVFDVWVGYRPLADLVTACKALAENRSLSSKRCRHLDDFNNSQEFGDA